MKNLLKLNLQFFGDPEPGDNQNPAPNPEEMLQKLMRDSVPKAEYEALKKQYNEFFAKVANGQFQSEEGGEKEPTEDEKQQRFYKAIDTIYNRKFKGSVEFMENALIIDDYLVAHGERSAFAPSRGDITPDIESRCENFNEAMKDALEDANGNDRICSLRFAEQIDTPYAVGSRS